MDNAKEEFDKVMETILGMLPTASQFTENMDRLIRGGINEN